MTSRDSQFGELNLRDSALILLASLIALLPLLLRGPSCGHDLDFHMTNWLEVSEQWRHGILWPRWAFSPGWGAGEPRFIFYPPLSWLLGGIFALVMPLRIIPAAFTFTAFLASGFTMRRLAAEFTSPLSATVGAVFYLANPYMLFCAYERCAYGELLAAAWIPLLLLAALKDHISPRRVAIAVALLWLTNVPSAVMGCYLFALIMLLRLLLLARKAYAGRHLAAMGPLLLRASAGAALGLGLAGFYLVPAVWEKRWIQVHFALAPYMRVQDNTLFHHTLDYRHDLVLLTASHVALVMIAISAASFFAAWYRRIHLNRRLTAVLGVTAFCLILGLTRASLFAWHLPELQYLQFPWRTLSLLAAVSGVLLALAAYGRRATLIVAAILLPLVLVPPAWKQFQIPCIWDDAPNPQLNYFRNGYGVTAFDEYTPATADNDALQDEINPYWLADDAQGISRHQPNTNGVIDFSTAEAFPLATPHPRFLMVRLRNYPGWQVHVNGAPATLIPRPDGLLAIALPPGGATVSIRYRVMPDEVIGALISLLALIIFNLLRRRSRHRGMNALSIPVPQGAPFLPCALPT